MANFNNPRYKPWANRGTWSAQQICDGRGEVSVPVRDQSQREARLPMAGGSEELAVGSLDIVGLPPLMR
jgi:hypothetical protein